MSPNKPGFDCFASFLTSLPEDAQMNEGGECIAPAGKALACILRERLVSAGLTVTPAEDDLEHFLWEFAIARGKARVACRIYHFEDCCFVGTEARGLFARRQRRELHEEVLSMLRSVLESDERFSHVRWAPSLYLAQQNRHRP